MPRDDRQSIQATRHEQTHRTAPVLEHAPPAREALLTWERLRHFHKEPRVIAEWRKWLGPGLRWLTPARRRLLLGIAALFIAVKLPWSNLTKDKQWPGAAPPDKAGLVLLVLALFG